MARNTHRLHQIQEQQCIIFGQLSPVIKPAAGVFTPLWALTAVLQVNMVITVYTIFKDKYTCKSI